ncbi:helix-turn-helix transcriptional regulator [Kutzneria sp. CA-103260]|uniref:helix-turn-helix transcriptional regulator n=1 Tax=Kutzneria sp. CA-103260 TaxID=2802641 RepID=UPI001BA6FE34|nr:helix-turn-helix transcriptional regulator [Kutzneria sp. CA-103260]QUQ65937.1 HTH-type transcriptional activator RhaS [Kutzneria sp. CA-103260]
MGLVVECRNLDEIEELIARRYASIRFTTRSQDQNRLRLTQNRLGPIALDVLDYSFEADYAVEPLGRVALFGVESGAFSHVETEGVRDSHGPGEVFLAAQPDRPYAGRECCARFSITLLEPALLSQVAATAPGRTDSPVRLTGFRPITPAAGQHLLHTITFLRDHVISAPTVGDAPLIASTAPQLLAATVLNTFPSTALTDPTTEDRHDAHPATLRRAMAFVDDHAHHDLTVADIAAAAHVTIRALQYAFRRHRATTPMGYLRDVRLHHAHQELLTTDPTLGATVTEIAARWGFFHPGRFARHYQRAYGHPPSRTLLRHVP